METTSTCLSAFRADPGSTTQGSMRSVVRSSGDIDSKCCAPFLNYESMLLGYNLTYPVYPKTRKSEDRQPFSQQGLLTPRGRQALVKRHLTRGLISHHRYELREQRTAGSSLGVHREQRRDWSRSVIFQSRSKVLDNFRPCCRARRYSQA